MSKGCVATVIHTETSCDGPKPLPPVEGLCGFSQSLQLRSNKLVLLCRETAHGLSHCKGHQSREHVLEVRRRGGEWSWLGKAGLPGWLKGAKAWYNIVVDKVVVLVDGFVVSLQSHRELLGQERERGALSVARGHVYTH